MWHLRGEAAIALSPISLPDLDPGRRLLAVCATPKGEVNANLVRQELAWAFVTFSDRYVPNEVDAKVARRGVLAAQNEPPWEFRAHRWDDAIKSGEAAHQRCPIKGNISRTGERIYHMPWQSTYEENIYQRGQGRALVLRRG